MRIFVLLFLLADPFTSFCQYEPGYLTELFFGRQANARADAMGKSYVTIDGDLGSVYSNPAGISSIRKIELDVSYTPPSTYLTKGYYTRYAVGYRINKYLQFALSQFHFDYGKTIVSNAITTPYSEKNTFTISSQPIRNLLLGLNTNYFVWQPGTGTKSSSFFFDFGMIKKIPVFSSKLNQQLISLGANISNFNYAHTNATFTGVDNKFNLPVVTTYGVNYNVKFGKCFFIDTVSTFNILLQSEYQILLNSKYRSGFKFGGEVQIVNLLSLRVGWYKEKVFNFNFPDYNNSEIKALTYGVGLQVPLYLLIKVPVNLNFDYTSLPQVMYSKTLPALPNFKTFNLRINIPF